MYRKFRSNDGCSMEKHFDELKRSMATLIVLCVALGSVAFSKLETHWYNAALGEIQRLRIYENSVKASRQRILDLDSVKQFESLIARNASPDLDVSTVDLRDWKAQFSERAIADQDVFTLVELIRPLTHRSIPRLFLPPMHGFRLEQEGRLNSVKLIGGERQRYAIEFVGEKDGKPWRTFVDVPLAIIDSEVTGQYVSKGEGNDTSFHGWLMLNEKYSEHLEEHSSFRILDLDDFPGLSWLVRWGVWDEVSLMTPQDAEGHIAKQVREGQIVQLFGIRIDLSAISFISFLVYVATLGSISWRLKFLNGRQNASMIKCVEESGWLYGVAGVFGDWLFMGLNLIPFVCLVWVTGFEVYEVGTAFLSWRGLIAWGQFLGFGFFGLLAFLKSIESYERFVRSLGQGSRCWLFKRNSSDRLYETTEAESSPSPT